MRRAKRRKDKNNGKCGFVGGNPRYKRKPHRWQVDAIVIDSPGGQIDSEEFFERLRRTNRGPQ